MNHQTYFPAPRRRHRKRQVVAATPAPVPLHVTAIVVLWLNPDDNRLYVGPQLDVSAENPLVGIETASPGKWWARYEGMRFSGLSVVQTDVNQIEVEFEYVDDEAGPNVFVYTNDPSDIGDASGRTLAAFSMQL